MDPLVCEDHKDKVTSILNQVSALSDSEKYLLYMKLPDVTDECLQEPATLKSGRNDFALSWIKQHYISDKDVCVPKQDVYEQYRQHCESTTHSPLSTGDFGKMIKLAFPQIHHRRLGQRGQKSVYCYWGLRKKRHSDSPSTKEVSTSVRTKESLSLYTLSCQLVCEWATQLLGRPFPDIRNLSEYLVSKGLSCGKTAAKFTLLSGSISPPKLYDKDRKSPNSKHHERQMLLQRKLQHNELIREHKEKLKQQQQQLRESHSATADSSGCSFGLTSYSITGMSPVTTSLLAGPGRKILPRPSSVQPYNQGVGLNRKQEAAMIAGLTAAFLGRSESQTSQDSAISVAQFVEQSSVVAVNLPKRCHSTSVVEKQSTSLLFGMLEATGSGLLSSYGSTESQSGCEKDDRKVLSYSSLPGASAATPVDMLVMSSPSSEGASIGQSLVICSKSNFGAQRNTTKLLEPSTLSHTGESLLMPQHPKRNGDNISPDRSSLIKRKCTTSLGVAIQQSFKALLATSDDHNCILPKSRPYSCPVSVQVAPSDSNINLNQPVTHTLMNKSSSTSGQTLVVDKLNLNTKGVPAESSTVQNKQNDSPEKTTPEETKTGVTVCHFVQKPTVINRVKSAVPSINPSPELKHSESSTDKQHYNILNTLLSANFDMLSQPFTSMHNLSSSSLVSLSTSFTLASSTLNTSPKDQISSFQGSSSGNLIASTPYENPRILSSLSSRSAFVPVTSHKLQAANSFLREPEAVAIIQPSQKPIASSDSISNSQLLPSTNITQSLDTKGHNSNKLAVSLIRRNSAFHACSDLSSRPKGLVATSKTLKNLNATITSDSSSSSSSSSTLCRSGDSMSSGCESVLTTPIPGVVAVDKPEDSVHVSVASFTVPTTSSSVSVPAAQCKPSPSTNSSTPVVSATVSTGGRNFQTKTSTSPFTPTKRVTRNRFTPIQPKLSAVAANAPSPHKLSGMTTPSPQKDARPVSVILKEQNTKCVINKSSNSPGISGLPLTSDHLGISLAGKSKVIDTLGNTRCQSNIASILQPSSSQSGEADCFTSTSLGKDITVVVPSISLSVNLPGSAPLLTPSCLAPNSSLQITGLSQQNEAQIISGSTLFPHSLPSLAVVPVTADSNFSQHPLVTSTGSNPQIIILPHSGSGSLSSPAKGNNLDRSFVVEDSMGNKYTLEQKAASVILQRNILQNYCPVNHLPPLHPNSLYPSTAAGFTNLSEITGHVIGPDTSGQTYLLVPNSESIVPTLNVSDKVSQNAHTVTNLTVNVSNAIQTSDSSLCLPSQGSTPPMDVLLPALVSRLGQALSNIVPEVDGNRQTVLAHNSSSSAFHKCASSTGRKITSVNDGEREALKDEGQGFSPKLSSVKLESCVAESDEAIKSVQSLEDIRTNLHGELWSDIQLTPQYQSIRKRKASKNEDCELRDRKRLNSSGNKKCEGGNDDDDDDVFIVKIEGTHSKTTLEYSDDAETSAAAVSTITPKSDTAQAESNFVNKPESNQAHVDEPKKKLTDTETLLGLIQDSKSMTIKETIKALNDLRVRKCQQTSTFSGTSGEEDLTHRNQIASTESLIGQRVWPIQRGIGTVKDHSSDISASRFQSVQRCSSVSPYPRGNSFLQTGVQETSGELSKTANKFERISRRHISLNLESLESDALLDTELTIDHRLVGDNRGEATDKIDQKTSVGIAVRSARPTSSIISSSVSNQKQSVQQDDKRACQELLINDKQDLDRVLGLVSKTKHGFPLWTDKRKPSSDLESHIKRPDVQLKNVESKDKISQCSDNDTSHGQSLFRTQAIRSITTAPIYTNSSAASKKNMSRAASVTNPGCSSGSGSKASEHPLLAHCLSLPSRCMLDLDGDGRFTSTATSVPGCEDTVEISAVNKNRTETAAETTAESLGTELPGDIADFITESMTTGQFYRSESFQGSSVTSLIADLVKSGMEEEDGKFPSSLQNTAPLRSNSLPGGLNERSVEIKITHDYDGDQKVYQKSGFPSKIKPITADRDTKRGSGLLEKTVKWERSSDPLTLQLDWDRTSQPTAGSLDSKIDTGKEVGNLVQGSQLSDAQSASSGVFLSPSGPVKLSRRSSLDRSSSGDRSGTKNQAETVTFKTNTERHINRSKLQVERSLIKSATEEVSSKISSEETAMAADRLARVAGRDVSLAKLELCRDLTTAAVLQQTEVPGDELQPLGSSSQPTSSAHRKNKDLSARQQENESHPRPTSAGWSLSQAPKSEVGYSKVNQTLFPGGSSHNVSSTPAMMPALGLFTECSQQQMTSAGAMFSPLRSDSVMRIGSIGQIKEECHTMGQSVLASFNLRPGFSVEPCLALRDIQQREQKEDTQLFLSQGILSSGETELQQVCNESLLNESKEASSECETKRLPDGLAVKEASSECETKRLPDGLAVKETALFQDLEKLMSAQLHCIPTPPRSPSTSPLHLGDNNNSPLSFSVSSSPAIHSPQTQQNWASNASSSTHSHHGSRYSAVNTISSHISCLLSNSLSVSSASLGSGGLHSPSLLHSSSPLPYGLTRPCMSPHQYNPHPSPPFTPSSQRCVTSPRCHTPCHQRSLMSPGCATPYGDLHLAPNRFMPIQTSGILTTSLTTTQSYIQPIRPQVTLASMTEQHSNLHVDLLGASLRPSLKTPISSSNHPCTDSYHTGTKSSDQSSSTVLKSLTSGSSVVPARTESKYHSSKIKTTEEKSHRKTKSRLNVVEEMKTDKGSQPALILSLTGSIGSVSGQGMQSGWKKDIIGPTSPSSAAVARATSYLSAAASGQNLKSEVDASAQHLDPGLDSETMKTVASPEEAVILLGHRDTSFYQRRKDNFRTRFNRNGKESDFDHDAVKLGVFKMSSTLTSTDHHHRQTVSSKKSPMGDYVDSSIQRISSSSKLSYQNVELLQFSLDPSRTGEMIQLSDDKSDAACPDRSTDILSPGQSLATISSSSTSSSYHRETPRTSSLSILLQAPLFVSQPASKPQIILHTQSSEEDLPSYSAVLKPEVFVSDQMSSSAGLNTLKRGRVTSKSLLQLSDLPTAYYTGTAPNVDLTKMPFVLSSRPVQVTTVEGLHHSMSDSHLETFLLPSPTNQSIEQSGDSDRPDELGETLNVLKTLDSQYFQQDEGLDMGCETAGHLLTGLGHSEHFL